MPCLERLLDIYFNNDITDIIIKIQKEQLLRISIDVFYPDVIEPFIEKYFNRTHANVTGNSINSINCIIMNYLGLIWEDSPDKYTAFENGYYPSCNFKYQNTIFSINSNLVLDNSSSNSSICFNCFS